MPTNNFGIKKAIAPIAMPAATTFKIDFVIFSFLCFMFIFCPLLMKTGLFDFYFKLNEKN